MLLQGNATFGGNGAGNQQFDGGQLTMLGNFSQIAGTVVRQEDQTFFTVNEHVTVFAGSTPQTVAFETSGASGFSILRLQNQSAGGVQLTTDAQIVPGTTQLRVDLIQGRLQVNSGQTFTLNSGWMQLGTSTNLNLLGNVLGVGGCTGRTAHGATITGLGLYNGTAYSSFTCDDDLR
jgi:hypothetical protein